MKLFALFLLTVVSLVAQDRGAIAYTSTIPGASIRAVAVDSAGNIYLAGATSVLPGAVDAFQTTAGAYQTQFKMCSVLTVQVGCSESFVVKLDASGKVVYATLLGGTVNDQATAITVDNAGNAIVTGYSYSFDFPVTVNAVQNHFNGTYTALPYANPFPPSAGGDVFVAKLNSTGSALLFSTLLGGSGDEVPAGVAVDSQNNVYVAGRTTSTNFPVTPGAYAAQPGSAALTTGSGFVTKLSADGSFLLYSTYFDDPVAGIAVDNMGAAYLTGKAQAMPPFPATAGAFQTRLNGVANAYVAKLKADGSALVYATLLGGSASDAGNSIAVDGNGDAYVAGQADSADFPLKNQITGQSGTGFLAEVSPDGTNLIFSTRTGGDRATRVLRDAQGNLEVFGLAAQYPIPVTANAFEKTTSGNFIERFNSSGQLLYATAIREGTPFTTDASGNAYVEARSGATDGIAKVDFALVSTAPGIGAVVNAASFAAGVSPGEIISIFGERLGPQTGQVFSLNSSGQVGTSLGGVMVTFDGVAVPLLYVSATQINAVAPFGLKPGATTNIVVQNNGANSTALPVTVSAAFAGIVRDGVGGNPMQGAVLNQDGSINSPSNPAALGSIVSLYGTGFGVQSPLPVDGSVINDAAHLAVLPVSVQFDEMITAQPVYAGSAPGFVAGVNQINVKLPSSLPAGALANLLTVQVGAGNGGFTDSGVVISVK